MTPPADQPRVRPSVWLLMLVMGGVGLLAFGHSHEWFLAGLETGTLHNLTYFLAWGLVGLACSLVASFIWLRWGRPPGRVRQILGVVFLAALMMVGSQVTARRVMHLFIVIVVDFDWDPDSQEFVVYVYPSPVVGGSLIRGDLEAIASIEGLWWSPSGVDSPLPLLESEVEEFSIGAPTLMGHSRGAQVLLHHGRFRKLERVEEVRVAWNPRRVGADLAYAVRMNASIVNREGKRVGPELTPHITESAYPLAISGRPDPHMARKRAFLLEGWAWLTDPDRNRSPFRVRPPPPLGIVGETPP